MGPKNIRHIHQEISSHNLKSASITTAGDSTQLKRGKDDYPIIALTNVNFPLWLLGVKTAIRKIKDGGDDLVHIIEYGSLPEEVESTLERKKSVYIDAASISKKFQRDIALLEEQRSDIAKMLAETKRDLRKAEATGTILNEAVAITEGPFSSVGAEMAATSAERKAAEIIAARDTTKMFHGNRSYSTSDYMRVIEALEIIDQCKDEIKLLLEDIDALYVLKNTAEVATEIAKSDYDTSAKAVKLREHNMDVASRQIIREILTTDLFLPFSKKAEIEVNLALKSQIDSLSSQGDLSGIIRVISGGQDDHDDRSLVQLAILKLQNALLKPAQGENFSSWMTKFNMRRMQNVHQGAVFDEIEVIAFFMQQIEDHYKYPWLREFIAPFKYPPKHPSYREVPTSCDDFILLVNQCCVDYQHSRGNFLNPSLDLKSTSKVSNSISSSLSLPTKPPPKKATPALWCKFNCKHKDGTRATHSPTDCPLTDPSEMKKGLAAYTQEQRDHYDARRVTSNVKAIASSKPHANFLKKAANSTTLADDSDSSSVDYTQFHFYESNSTTLCKPLFPTPSISAFYIDNVRQAQLDNGSNVTIMDSPDGLHNVHEISDITVTPWSGKSASTDSVLNVKGHIPGFGDVYVKPGAQNIFPDYQFSLSGWSLTSTKGIESNGKLIDMFFTYSKGRHFIPFQRAQNGLIYCPLSEVLLALHSAFQDDLLAANVATRATSHRRNYASDNILTSNHEPTLTPTPPPIDDEPTLPSILSPNDEPTILPPPSIISEPTQQIQLLPVPQPTNELLPIAPLPANPLLDVVITPDDENYHLLQPRINHRGGNRPPTAREIDHIAQVDRLHKSSHFSPRKNEEDYPLHPQLRLVCRGCR